MIRISKSCLVLDLFQLSQFPDFIIFLCMILFVLKSWFVDLTQIGLMQTCWHFWKNQIFVGIIAGICQAVERIDEHVFYCIFQSLIALLVEVIHFVERPDQNRGFTFPDKVSDLSRKDIDHHKGIFGFINLFELRFGIRNHLYDLLYCFCVIHFSNCFESLMPINIPTSTNIW